MKPLYLCLFGSLGVLSRYYLGLILSQLYPTFFPLPTFLINTLGSFLIGIAYVLGQEKGLFHEEMGVIVAVGFLGGFTTFSAFSLELVRLLETSNFLYALLYFTLSPLLGVLAAFLGVILIRNM